MIVILDSGVLGILCSPNPSPDAHTTSGAIGAIALVVGRVGACKIDYQAPQFKLAHTATNTSSFQKSATLPEKKHLNESQKVIHTYDGEI